MKVKVFHIRLAEENLEKDQEVLNEFLGNVSVKKTSTELVNGSVNFWSVVLFYENIAPGTNTAGSDKIAYPADAELDKEENSMYSALKHWRYHIAKELDTPAFRICTNADLVNVVKTKPQTVEDLAKIRGFAEQKIAKYGDDIIAVLNSI